MVTVRFFAVIRERASRDAIDLPLEAPIPLARFLQTVVRSVPEIGPILNAGNILAAVNQEAAGVDAWVRDGDEVALMPPFSGGGSGPGKNGSEFPERSWTRIQSGDFSVEEEIGRVKSLSGRIGGIAVFLGTARDFSLNRPVERLSYEHYPGMAERQLEHLRAEAKKRHPIIECLIIHRTGDIPAGGNIVLVIAAAEHRDDAFAACRWCIDELKATAPIWKKEWTADGSVWVRDRP